jgi:hypothetical protein
MAIRDGLVVDENFCLVPIVDDVEQIEKVVDFGRREDSRVPDPFPLSFFPIGRIPLGQGYGLAVFRVELVPEDDRDAEDFRRFARMKDFLEFLLGGLIRIHGTIVPENDDGGQSAVPCPIGTSAKSTYRGRSDFSFIRGKALCRPRVVFLGISTLL